MMPISPLNRLLLLVCGMLLLIFIGLWVTPIDEGWLDNTKIAPVSQPPLAIQASLPLASTDNLNNRPIFDPSRRAAAISDTSAASSQPSATLSLAGLIIGGGARIALIRSSDSKDLVRAREGDTISNWLIKSIDARRVVITANGVTQELRFPTQPASGGPGAGFGSGGNPGVHSY